MIGTICSVVEAEGPTFVDLLPMVENQNQANLDELCRTGGKGCRAAGQ
jgi:hypothetical protein